MIRIVGTKSCGTCRKAMALLDSQGKPYRFRDYKAEPLDRDELKALLERLGVPASALLRKRDPAYRELGLTGGESDAVLLRHLAEHPTLLERPVAWSGKRALVARPAERILEL